jgi:hypothetical protein
VLLDLLLLIPAIPLAVYEAESSAFAAFDPQFLELVTTSFGSTGLNDVQWSAIGVGLIVHIGSTVGLLWFKRPARFLYWASMLWVLGIDMVWGQHVSYSSWLLTPLDWLSSALFGAILLTSYAAGMGGDWFTRNASSDYTLSA